MSLIQVKNIIKTFKDGDKETRVLKGIDFSAEEGEWISIMGRSGAGKSTLMYQMSLLDDPTSGEIYLFGRDAHNMSADEKTDFRLNELGYVFQDYALIPELSAIENVALPLLMQGKTTKEAYTLAHEALARLKLAHRIRSLPSNMSGGEQQRVSIARAVVHKPKILFADEPTANLDNDSSGVIMGIFKELHAEGQTIIMVTHELEYAQMAQKIITIDDGQITSIRSN